MTLPTPHASRKSAAPRGERAAFGLIAAVVLGVSAAMLFSLLSRTDGSTSAATTAPAAFAPTQAPHGAVPNAATVFAGHDLSPEAQPPSF